MAAYRETTDDQLAMLDAVEKDINAMLEKSRESLAQARLPIGAEETTHCLRCSCDNYTRPHPESGAHRPSNCVTPGCGHSFFSHNVW